MSTAPSPLFAPGLEGVLVAETQLSEVDGAEGRLLIRGRSVAELAGLEDFEHAVASLWHGDLGRAGALRRDLAAKRQVSVAALEAVTAASTMSPIAGLRVGVAALGQAQDPVALLAAMPVLLGALAAARRGKKAPIVDRDPGLARFLLGQLDGTAPTAARVEALDIYLRTVMEHGMNASTFTARVVASTQADLGAAVTAALAALEGPLHGGAPGPAVASFMELRVKSHGADDFDVRVRRWVRDELAAGRRIMGFGHRVYRVRDPRAEVLGDATKALLGDDPLVRDAQIYERGVTETLRELKPGRPLAANVEFATGILLRTLGLHEALYPAVFAVARTAGWAAHYAEQRETGRLIRPRARYIGPRPS